MHCLAAVYNEDYWSKQHPDPESDAFYRAMWRKPQSFSQEAITHGKDPGWWRVTQGFYLFGGVGNDGLPCNDLWVLEPDY